MTYNADRVKQIIEATTQSKPPGATHWSTRTMAKAQGVSKATVQELRIWFAHGLQPHRTKRFKLSKDPHFTEKLTEKRVRRGSFESVPELIAAIEQYLAASNAEAPNRSYGILPLKRSWTSSLNVRLLTRH